MIEHAIRYAEMGWAVLPLHSIQKNQCTCNKKHCYSPGKHPITYNGLKSATTDKDTIKTWFKQWKNANLGIATGTISGISVLDIDPRHGGEDSLDELSIKYGKLPQTVEAITQSKGRHIIFQHEEGFRTTAGKLGRGIDTRGDGGYIVAAPSRGVQGEYEWEASSEPDSHPIAKIPSYVIQLLNHGQVNADFQSEKLGPGLRNAYLCSIAGTLRSRGVSFRGILACLLAENTERCSPCLDEKEVFSIAKSIMRYEPKPIEKVKINAKIH